MKLLPRRQFIRNSTLAVGASALAGPFIRSVRAGEPGPNDKIRLGLIGSGGMGRGDLECFFGNPEVDCVVIADVDEGMTASCLGLLGEEYPRSTQQLLRRLGPNWTMWSLASRT